ncbi:hypothetical protein P154DRAFT_616557 [Amniculicola lignicola CBS 123094]|uniref:Uncharacterized protein n=1 Tax=Amniculicola lignicola CBS 123094 TaxID=1392246 RepID=A0A6A5WUS2_9PLEO|nr:hypothetical protein P154DRAFT_616557 [Amniculicola lignicola CBS 123094]
MDSKVRSWLFSSEYGNVTYRYIRGQAGDPAISGNVNITSDNECFGQIIGDPDIAGKGVILGVILSAAITSVLSIWAFWYPYAHNHWTRAKIEHGVGPGMAPNAANTTNIASTTAVQSPGASRTARNRLHTISSSSTAPTNPPVDHEDDDQLTPMERLILGLGDMNLVTTLAIIISSMVNMSYDKHYPLYHIFIARSLAGSAIEGHNSASFVYAKFQRKKRYSLFVRWALSFAALALYVAWSIMAESRFRQEENRKWPKFRPICLSDGDNIVGGTWIFWIRLEMYFFQPVAFIWILVSPSPYASRLDKIISRIDAFIIMRCKLFIKKHWTNIRPQTHLSTWGYFLAAVTNVLIAVFKTACDVCLVVFCSLFVPSDATMPISQIVFGLVWHIYDITTIRTGNKVAVVNILDSPGRPKIENPESKWGFGQIFPIVILLQIFITLLDYLGDCFDRKLPPSKSGPKSRVWPHRYLDVVQQQRNR